MFRAFVSKRLPMGFRAGVSAPVRLSGHHYFGLGFMLGIIAALLAGALLAGRF